MAQILKSEKARLLRKEGLSIGEISSKLKVGKSTISYWCRDILLTADQLRDIARRKKNKSVAALTKYVESLRLKRLERVKMSFNKGREDLKESSKRDLFIVGLALYWAEGYKKGNNELGFTNSDPAMIAIILKWFKEVYAIKYEDFILRVSINADHEDRVTEVINYWARITGISTTQFTMSSLIKTSSKKEYLNRNDHFGTLRVKVRRGYDLRCRILGSIDAIKDFSYSN